MLLFELLYKDLYLQILLLWLLCISRLEREV